MQKLGSGGYRGLNIYTKENSFDSYSSYTFRDFYDDKGGAKSAMDDGELIVKKLLNLREINIRNPIFLSFQYKLADPQFLKTMGYVTFDNSELYCYNCPLDALKMYGINQMSLSPNGEEIRAINLCVNASYVPILGYAYYPFNDRYNIFVIGVK